MVTIMNCLNLIREAQHTGMFSSKVFQTSKLLVNVCNVHPNKLYHPILLPNYVFLLNTHNKYYKYKYI